MSKTAAIILIGNEILSGKVTDLNAAYLCRELRALGVDVRKISVIADDVGLFGVVAVNFPKYADGRGYSIARLLRERYGYTGELRAVGEVARDHLHAMAQCGFDAFQLRAGEDAQAALAAFGDFSESYQATAARPQPLFRRRA